jgi:hypothetical protein
MQTTFPLASSGCRRSPRAMYLLRPEELWLLRVRPLRQVVLLPQPLNEAPERVRLAAAFGRGAILSIA